MWMNIQNITERQGQVAHGGDKMLKGNSNQLNNMVIKKIKDMMA